MKKILALLVSVFAMFAYDAVASNNENTTSPQTENYPQVCKFSLNHYTGTIVEIRDCALVSGVVVLLNCPQTEDVCATVTVFVDGEPIASEVICIKAGRKDSGSGENIVVPSEYIGEKYTLIVE